MDILQDETGYIRLASYDGLIRFDGNTFTLFTEREHDFNGVSPRVLCEDVEGSLWIGTNSTGLYKYGNHEFSSYGINDGLPNISIRAIQFDKNKTLWVGTADGLAMLQLPADDTKEPARFVPILSDSNTGLSIISFVLPVQDSIFIGSNL